MCTTAGGWHGPATTRARTKIQPTIHALALHAQPISLYTLYSSRPGVASSTDQPYSIVHAL
eukprot:4420569-Prymnesium_polylepis.1